ncbi:hypothetical protein ACH5RR_015397 [Cinchona calisaya]|uniref:Uncharacterized protein n=1 Tax=Cinchona calisaya TaxID=153742 RepID=A0ABD2ZU98_9GENT
MWKYPPEVRTAIPVEGRFEHIVLSYNATSDHAIIWIEREAEKAMEKLKESIVTVTMAPQIRKIESLHTLEKEHKDALERAVSLNMHHAVPTAEEGESSSSGDKSTEPCQDECHEDTALSKTRAKTSDARTNWSELVQKLFEKGESGQLPLKKDATVSG